MRLAADGSRRLPRPGGNGAGKSQGEKGPKAPRPVRENPAHPIDWKKLRTRTGLQEALRSAVVHHPLLTAARPVPPVLAEGWADAVAAADARAVARARAAAPDIKVTVRDLPPPDVAAASVTQVAPLVESALRHDAVPAEAVQHGRYQHRARPTRAPPARGRQSDPPWRCRPSRRSLRGNRRLPDMPLSWTLAP